MYKNNKNIMIYIEASKHVFCPRFNDELPKSFVLENQSTHKRYVFNITNISTSSYYYEFGIDSSCIDEGQYNYFLLNNNGINIANGIAQYGNYKTTQKEYTHEKNIKQYNG